MNLGKIYQYVESGLSIPPIPKQFKQQGIAPFILVMVMGIVPGIVLKGWWLLLSLTMLSVSLLIGCMVLIYSKRALNTINRLKLQGLIYSNWIIQIVLLEIMYYTIAFGFNLLLVFICLIPVLTPCFIGIINDRRLRFDAIPLKTNCRFLFSFAWTGLAGIGLGKILFQNASQKAAIAFVILSLVFLSSVLSIGLLAYQRILYIKLFDIDC